MNAECLTQLFHQISENIYITMDTKTSCLCNKLALQPLCLKYLIWPSTFICPISIKMLKLKCPIKKLENYLTKGLLSSGAIAN